MANDFSNRLRVTIEHSGLKREEFAEKAGIGRTQIFRYLKGEQEPTLSFFQRLKIEFPWVDLVWLMTGEETPIVAEPHHGYGKSDQVKEKINQMLDEMNEEKRRDVLKYAEEKKQLSDLLAQHHSKKAG